MKVRPLMLAAFAALLGCGGGGGFSTSVPSNTKLTDLTPAQDTQLCNDYQTFLTQDVAPDYCRLDALSAAAALLGQQPAPSDAQLQTACTQEYNTCVSPDGGFLSSADGGTCQVSSDIPATCTATIGDLETCNNDELAAEKQLTGAVPSCASLTQASLLATAAMFSGNTDIATPASCTKFGSTCGDAFPSGDSSSSAATIFPHLRLGRR